MTIFRKIYLTLIALLTVPSLGIAEEGYFTNGPNFVQGLVECGRFYKEGTECRELATTFGYSKGDYGWEAPAGTITDGASIPVWAQWFIGAPFSKEFEAASILHDHYVRPENQVRTYLETQRMFYDALIDSEVDPIKAGTMYAAILVGGNAWTVLVAGDPCEYFERNCVRTLPQPLNLPSVNRVDSSFDKIDMESLMIEFAEKIELQGLSPEEIQALALGERISRGIVTPSPITPVE